MSEAQKKAPEKKAKKSLLYAVAKPIAALLFKTFLPVKFHNREGLNGEPPFVLIGNHTSLMDPVIMGVGVKKHQVRFIGKKELWKNKLVGAAFNSMNMIPVDRHNSDMEAMRACMRVTREGNILGIFPEGTRHHKGLMEEIESGVALIALRSRQGRALPHPACVCRRPDPHRGSARTGREQGDLRPAADPYHPDLCPDARGTHEGVTIAAGADSPAAMGAFADWRRFHENFFKFFLGTSRNPGKCIETIFIRAFCVRMRCCERMLTHAD